MFSTLGKKNKLPSSDELMGWILKLYPYGEIVKGLESYYGTASVPSTLISKLGKLAEEG